MHHDVFAFGVTINRVDPVRPAAFVDDRFDRFVERNHITRTPAISTLPTSTIFVMRPRRR